MFRYTDTTYSLKTLNISVFHAVLISDLEKPSRDLDAIGPQRH